MERKLSILIVDDDPDLLLGLKTIFTNRGFITDGATNGKSALTKIMNNGYDAVLTDIKMPEMDGIELLKEIRKIKTNVPVILITAYATINLALEAMKSGANDFITKPFDINHIVKVVEINTLAKRDYIKREDLTDNETRDKIYDLIIHRPGLIFTEIQRELAIGNGVLSYHIHLLEKNDFIKTKKIRGSKRYFPARISATVEPALGLNPKAKELWETITNNPGISTKELATITGISRELANYHLRTLLQEHSIVKKREGKSVKYYPSSPG